MNINKNGLKHGEEPYLSYIIVVMSFEYKYYIDFMKKHFDFAKRL